MMIIILFKILQNDGVAPANNLSDDPDCNCSSTAPEIANSTSGNSESWMVLSIAGDKPTPRFNVRCDWL